MYIGSFKVTKANRYVYIVILFIGRIALLTFVERNIDCGNKLHCNMFEVLIMILLYIV